MFCTYETTMVEADTYCSGALTEAERLDYVNAVKCLQGLSARTPESVATGAKSRV